MMARTLSACPLEDLSQVLVVFRRLQPSNGMAGQAWKSQRQRLALYKRDLRMNMGLCQYSLRMSWQTDITMVSQVRSTKQTLGSLLICMADSILWPLFHYHPGEITFDESAWTAYKEVNRLFAKTMVKDVQDGDLIWVHDYHLMLLPEMLREEIGSTKKNVKIGFFLHTPFPSSEIYRILPVREALLLGVLHCDLIGFHTYDYARHFLSSCSRIL
jgi:trehalose-6-phosphate synthase